MKTKAIYAALLLLGFVIKFRAQDTIKVENFKELSNYVTANFTAKYPGLTFLRYRLISPVANIFDTYQGSANDPTLTFTDFYGLINDASMANCKEDPKINTKHMQQLLLNTLSNNKTALCISLIENYKFKDSTIIFEYVDFQNNKFIDNSPAGYFPFDKDTLFAVCPLNEVLSTNTVSFYFDEDQFLSNLDFNQISSLKVDFGDGIGFRELKLKSTNEVLYSTDGEKTIQVELIMNGQTFISKSKITINTTSANRTNSTLSCSSTTISATIDDGPFPIQTTKLGNYVSGKYAIWYSTCNTNKKIRKPFIICAGYNPGNGKQFTQGLFNDLTVNFAGNTIDIPLAGGWNGEWRGTFYETYNGSYAKRFSVDEYCNNPQGTSNGNELLDRLRDEGYDIIILANDDGKDVTMNNAALFIELVEKINQEKFNNGYYFENVAAGFSAGGITTRMALAIMESRYKQGIGPHPHTKLWVSIEGENQGANIPIGLQHLLRFQSDGFYTIPSLNSLKLSADLINNLVASLAYGSIDSDNANEILAYNASVSGGYPHPLRNNLLSQLASIPLNSSNGYPEFCRRIAVSQGSGVGFDVPHTSDKIFDSYLGTNLSGTAVSFPHGCGGTYTWVAPSCYKSTTARYWSANNNQNVFDGVVHLDASFTWYPLTCIKLPNILGGACKCMGPYTANIPIQIKQTHISEPTYLTGNFDDAPASTLSTQIELYKQSAYPFYNSYFGGQGHASYDPKLHAFTTTSSVLDLHDPNNGYQVNNFLSPSGLNLMRINPADYEANRRYGFPYINYPTNHYQITPFDGVYAIGDNNGNFSNGTPKPRNQLHVEDAQQFIGDYLTRSEIAPENLFLTNRNLAATQSNYIAEFEARSKITVGKEDVNGLNIYALYGNKDYLTPNGDFNVAQNSSAIIHAGDEIAFLPGTSVDPGASLAAYIQPYSCPNALYRLASNVSTNNGETSNSAGTSTADFSSQQPDDNTNAKGLKIYPNPNNGLFTLINKAETQNSKLEILDITGKVIFEENIINNQSNSLNLQYLQNGFYVLLIKNDTGLEKFKIMISK